MRPAPRPALRMLIALLSALAAGPALVGCNGDGAGPAPTTASAGPSLDDLGAAIDLVNDGRATVLERVRAVIGGLERRDAVDAVAADGDRTAARQLDEAADVVYARTAPALNDVGLAIEAFQSGLDDLARAAVSGELDTAQRRLLGTVVAEGRAEISRTRALAAAVRAALPTYDLLGADLDEWLRRARAGWYRTQREAADAYAVLTADVRDALLAGREGVNVADAARVDAVVRTTRALQVARRALAPLTTRETVVPSP